MKAAVLKNWFDLELTDIPVPVPNDKEALIKVRCTPDQRTEVLQLCDHFKAHTVDMTEKSMIIQITGSSDKVDNLKSLLQKFEIVEYIRTGKVIMLRGEDKT